MGKIQEALQPPNQSEVQKKPTMNSMLNDVLSKEGLKSRFEQLLGKRTEQFLSSIISLINADINLQKAFFESPMSVIQAALKAAVFDLPIDPNLGYAYIIPFSKTIKNAEGTTVKRTEASFIMGYKGMNQLALRTGAYKTINVTDIREGELKSYNRLKEEIEIEFIEDEEEREKKPIIGWCGYFKLMNGAEKVLYMTKSQIEAHEKKNRKGSYQSKGWRDDFNTMAEKTVFRRLIGKYGLMSIEYQSADTSIIELANAAMKDEFNESHIIETPPEEESKEEGA